MIYRYYITDLYTGNILGTSSEEVATQFAASDDYFVVDTECGTLLLSDGESIIIKEVGK